MCFPATKYLATCSKRSPKRSKLRLKLARCKQRGKGMWKTSGLRGALSAEANCLGVGILVKLKMLTVSISHPEVQASQGAKQQASRAEDWKPRTLTSTFTVKNSLPDKEGMSVEEDGIKGVVLLPLLQKCCKAVIVKWINHVQFFATAWTTAGLAALVLHYLPEFAQIRVHWIGDAV